MKASYYDAGWPECKITVSNSLDEFIIQDLLIQGAQITGSGRSGPRRGPWSLRRGRRRAGRRWCRRYRYTRLFRNVPDDGGYAIAAGLEQVVDYIQNLHFEPEDIEYLRGR